MTGFGILILIVLFFCLIGPAIGRWLQRKALERAADYINASMGFPPREKKRKRRGIFGGTREENDTRRQQAHSSYRHPFGKEPIIPKEYAEDVEYTEIKEFTSREIHISSDDMNYQESQISDVEYVEFKTDRSQ